MIHPDEIRRKSTNLYPAFLRAWLRRESFFPKTIPCRMRVEDDLATALASVQRLRQGSKSVQGCGYAVEWIEINSRRHGRNLFPKRIVLETEADFLKYLGKQQEFSAFASTVDRIRSKYPELVPWIQSHISILIQSASEVDGLLQIVDYFRTNPRPGLFARELPVRVDTKFIERNKRVLREWLDRVLPPHAIRADEEHFERRFGLRYAEPHIMVRFLDSEAQRASGCPWSEFSLPLLTLADLRVMVDQVVIVENKVNVLTLPMLPSTLALGGLGNSVMDLRCLPWLRSCSIWYWGDIDGDGFVILSRLRNMLPHTRSLLMDSETLSRWQKQLAIVGSGVRYDVPAGLTESEKSAFMTCLDENLRLEQERLPHEFVNRFLQNQICRLPGKPG